MKSDLKKILNTKNLRIFSPNSNYKINYSSIKIQNAVFLKKNFEYSITPMECRQRDVTYSSHLYVNLKFKVFGKIFSFNNFNLCKIPLMLQSKNCILSGKTGVFFKTIKECSVDPGGYFIVRGNEKIILIQEQLTLNRIFIEIDSCNCPCAIIITNGISSKLKNIIVLKNRKLFFRHKIFIEDIPLIVIFRYFKFDNNRDLCELIGIELKNLIKSSLHESKLDSLITKEQASSYLIKRIDERFSKKIRPNFISYKKESSFKNQDILIGLFNENILVNINEKKLKNIIDYHKGIFLTVMTRRLFIGMNRSDYTDTKDYYGNKRVELAGDLIGILFDDLFSRANREFKKQLILNTEKHKKEYFFDLNKSFRSDIITNGIEMAFITGNWSIKKYRIERSGVTQAISRANQISCLSNITKIISSCEKTRRGAGPRALHSSQWGLICPSDTPEGESCGLVKSLTLLAHISIMENSRFVKWLTHSIGITRLGYLHSQLPEKNIRISTIFINGKIVGYHNYPPKLLYTFRFLRRVGLIGKYTSIFWNNILKNVYINTDSGRICRPFIIVSSGKIRLKEKDISIIKKAGFYWKDFLRDGTLEFLDTNEENNASIASTKDKINTETTHMELSPLVILGLCASTIPLCNHNQSPRNTYQCAMGKQSSGTISFNQHHRTDTLLSVLTYPQKSLVKTKTLNLLGIDKLPTGTNTYVCVMSFSGYDLEDSIVLNKESILRGFSRTTLIRKHKIIFRDTESIKNKEYMEEIYKCWGGEKSNITCGENKKGQSPCIKENFYTTSKTTKENDKKIQYKVKSNWMINHILYTNDVNGSHFIKLILRQTRRPEIGDKFSSRHGQKGVCGLICPQENLPFSVGGMIPDLIMNPHGFPSRMTIGKLIELIGGKNSLLRGNFFNGTAFCGKNISEFNSILRNIGFSSDGKEFLICGLTGEPLKQEVFCGPVHYQRLKHMVKDKIHARSRGNRSCLTRQPIEGRSKGGGLRFGEMERDCVVGFGCSELLTERLMLSSDVFLANFDYYTGLMALEDSSKQNVKIKLPYACKLLFQELQSMNITPKLNLKNKNFFFDEF